MVLIFDKFIFRFHLSFHNISNSSFFQKPFHEGREYFLYFNLSFTVFLVGDYQVFQVSEPIDILHLFREEICGIIIKFFIVIAELLQDYFKVLIFSKASDHRSGNVPAYVFVIVFRQDFRRIFVFLDDFILNFEFNFELFVLVIFGLEAFKSIVLHLRKIYIFFAVIKGTERVLENLA